MLNVKIERPTSFSCTSACSHFRFAVGLRMRVLVKKVSWIHRLTIESIKKQKIPELWLNEICILFVSNSLLSFRMFSSGVSIRRVYTRREHTCKLSQQTSMMGEELKKYLSAEQYDKFCTYTQNNRLPQSFDVCTSWLLEMKRLNQTASISRQPTQSKSMLPMPPGQKTNSTYNPIYTRTNGKLMYVLPMFDRKRIPLPRTMQPSQKSHQANKENVIYDYELYL